MSSKIICTGFITKISKRFNAKKITITAADLVFIFIMIFHLILVYYSITQDNGVAILPIQDAV